MRIVDLFSGLGGLTIGAFEASQALGKDFEIFLANDMEVSCYEFYQNNFESYIKHFHKGNIADLEVESFSTPKIDYLFAGPPCQGHSDLNNRSRRDDPRNNLYLETLKVIKHLRPNVFLIENVPSVVHSQQDVVCQLKKKLKHQYHIKELIVDFEKMGIAQTRKRHIILGSLERIDDFLEAIYTKSVPQTLRDTIYDLKDIESDTLFDTASRMTAVNKKRASFLHSNNLYDLPNELRPKCHQSHHSYKSMYGRLNWDKPSQTITGGFGSMGQGRFLHPSKLRVITPHEAARIQGLPDYLNFSCVNQRIKLHQMIGNAVPPILSKELIMKMEKKYEY